MKQDLVSIVIPMFNSEKYIERCLESIICQSYFNLEIILVDDGSNDSTVKLCEKYMQDNRIKLICQENRGNANARNVGLNHVSGQYVVFVDSDDYVEKDMIKVMLAACQEYGAEIAIVAHWIESINDQRISDESKKTVLFNKAEAIERAMDLKGRSFSGFLWNKMFLTVLFERERTICFDNKVHMLVDLPVVCQLMDRAERIVYVPKPLYHYCIHNDSIAGMGKKFDIRKLTVEKSTESLCYFVEEYYPELKPIAYAIYIQRQYTLLRMMVYADYRDKSEIKRIKYNILNHIRYIKDCKCIEIKVLAIVSLINIKVAFIFWKLVSRLRRWKA